MELAQAGDFGSIHFGQPLPDEEEDETLAERLWGLTEMFPEPLRSVVSTLTYGSARLYGFSRNALWIVGSTATIMVLPYLFEKERSEIEQMHLQRQKATMLGPHFEGSSPRSPTGLGMGLMPPAPGSK